MKNFKNIGFATVVASGLTAAVLGLAAPATAAASDTGSAQDVVSSLQSEGYRVFVSNPNRIPLDVATVSSVTPGNDVKEWVRDITRDHLVLKTVAKTVNVDVK